jgi:hypothetical protein
MAGRCGEGYIGDEVEEMGAEGWAFVIKEGKALRELQSQGVCSK